MVTFENGAGAVACCAQLAAAGFCRLGQRTSLPANPHSIIQSHVFLVPIPLVSITVSGAGGFRRCFCVPQLSCVDLEAKDFFNVNLLEVFFGVASSRLCVGFGLCDRCQHKPDVFRSLPLCRTDLRDWQLFSVLTCLLERLPCAPYSLFA